MKYRSVPCPEEGGIEHHSEVEERTSAELSSGVTHPAATLNPELGTGPPAAKPQRQSPNT